MNRPLVQIAIGWLVGVMCFQLTGSQWFLYMCGIIVSVVIGVMIITKFNSWTPFVIVSLTTMVSGFLYSYVFLQNHSHLPIKQGDSVYVSGTIQSKPIRDGNQLRFDLQLFQIKHSNRLIRSNERIRVLIKLDSVEQWIEAQQVQRGWKIQARLDIENPPLPRNPGAFDYATYLQRQSIFWFGKGTGLQTLHHVGTEKSLIT